MNPQLRRSLVLSAICFILLIGVIFSARHRHDIVLLLPSHDFYNSSSTTTDMTAANATLGFERILALTTGTSWRINGLRAAANHTGLLIDYPIQPHNAPEVVAAFEKLAPEESKRPPHGSALAWIAHINLLEHIVQSGWATALIMEDDVDWDVALRDTIMMPLAQGVRNYTDAAPDDATTPYGSNWDVLWMGHCGEWSHDDMPYHAWPDETVISHAEYVGWASVDMKARLPEGVRTTHPTTNTVCSFAYGVTANSAQRILDLVASGDGEAFDVALSAACSSKKLHCVTIHPEVFHQYVPAREGGDWSEVRVLNVEGEVEATKFLEDKMGSTANVRHSARCAALFHSPCQELPLPESELQRP